MVRKIGMWNIESYLLLCLFFCDEGSLSKFYSLQKYPTTINEKHRMLIDYQNLQTTGIKTFVTKRFQHKADRKESNDTREFEQQPIKLWKGQKEGHNTTDKYRLLLQQHQDFNSSKVLQQEHNKHKNMHVLHNLTTALSEHQVNFQNKRLPKVPNISLSRKKLENHTKDGRKEQISYNEHEYPGENTTARTQLLNLWKDYYTCLTEKSHFAPQAHYSFPGSSIRLECNACLEPGSSIIMQWGRATIKTNHQLEKIIPMRTSGGFSGSERLIIAENGLTLSIFGVQEKDAGNYTCTKHQTLMSVHLIQVAMTVENVRKVWPKNAAKKPHAAPQITLPSLGITVFTKWTNWTSCSRCGRAGKRIKFGACTVALTPDNHIRSGPNILTTFKYGLPCKSILLPSSIRSHPYVTQRHSEVLETFCKVPCPKNGKYIVKNKSGKIVEEADNDAGVYSMLQKLPQLSPPIHRSIIFMEQWETVRIQCPGGQHNDVPVRWFRRNEPIFPKDERIYVSPMHTLVIEDLGLSDSMLYSCWQNGRLVGTIRLHVAAPLRLSFSQQLSALSMLLIVATFITIFIRAICNSLQETNHHDKQQTEN